ncbi:hypothetical protein HETIRDRAFT_406534 [Heterobasidion irregulare TC 32-1]|uniref:Uncharacterized protein n=1 Tax=Heterobasidion irregulare (strain TC 32-1) TaxID=747525 RepID=W4KKR8_HETIT|nr:uncharacterized protein HETIRDRAFT_406534 [Heterobasidion irregulare TC 32-1]ETW86417.1 hypothetical protein HETIRDRAFT_406534 [Heterobasidion irregulare TC 32-1]
MLVRGDAARQERMNRNHGSNKDVSIRLHIRAVLRGWKEYTDEIEFIGDGTKVTVRSEAPGV